MCGMPVVMESPYSIKVMLSETVDLHQLPVQLPDANDPYPGIMVAYFKVDSKCPCLQPELTP